MTTDAERTYLRGLDAASTRLYAAQDEIAALERLRVRAELRGLVRDFLIGMAMLAVLAIGVALAAPELPVVMAQLAQEVRTASCPPPQRWP